MKLSQKESPFFDALKQICLLFFSNDRKCGGLNSLRGARHYLKVEKMSRQQTPTLRPLHKKIGFQSKIWEREQVSGWAIRFRPAVQLVSGSSRTSASCSGSAPWRGKPGRCGWAGSVHPSLWWRPTGNTHQEKQLDLWQIKNKYILDSHS